MTADAEAHFAPSRTGSVKFTTVAAIKSDAAPAPAEDTRDSIQASAKRGGWLIQVGAFDEESDAKHRLELCRNKAKSVLDQADPFTEPVAKGAKTLYRARFAGLDKAQAEAACKSLKRGEIPCMTLKN
jgi:D-alanyl-D-alanine carboxypeptidase